MKNSGKAQLYYDTLLIHTLLSDGRLTKTAQSGIVGSIIDAVKSFFSRHFNENDKVGSVINMLAPGTLAMLGFPLLGVITEIATSWFGLDLGKIFEEIAGDVKSLIMGGATTTSSAVEGIVQRAVSGNISGDVSQDDLTRAQQNPIKMSMRQVQLYKIALQAYRDGTMTKRARFTGWLGGLAGLRRTTTSSLIKIIGWIVKVILASAGFMAADDAIHSLVGVPSHTDFSTPQATDTSGSGSSGASTTISAPIQTTFKINPSYTEDRLNLSDRWIEPVAPTQMGDEIVQWTHDIYPDTKTLSDEDIKDTAGFIKAMQLINDYNSTNKLNVTFIPRLFTSRKKVVDLFIDELANKAPLPPKAPTTPTAPTHTPPKVSDLM